MRKEVILLTKTQYIPENFQLLKSGNLAIHGTLQSSGFHCVINMNSMNFIDATFSRDPVITNDTQLNNIVFPDQPQQSYAGRTTQYRVLFSLP